MSKTGRLRWFWQVDCKDYSDFIKRFTLMEVDGIRRLLGKTMSNFDLWQEVAQVNNKWRGKSREHLASPDLSRKWPLYMCVCIVYVNFNCLLIMCFRLCCSVISRLSNRLLQSVPWQVVLLSAKSSASVLHFVAHWHTTVKLLKFRALLAFRLLTLRAGNINTEPSLCHSVPLIHLQHMALYWLFSFITFRTSHRWCEVYIGNACLCVCVCLSAATCPHYCTDPDVSWEMMMIIIIIMT